MMALDTRSLYRIAWTAVGLMAVGSIVGIIVPAGLGWDFANFYDAGQKAAAGYIAQLYDPFFEVPGRPPLADLQFWSAPVTAYLFAPMAALPPAFALTLFKVQNVLAYAVGLPLLFVEYRRIAGGDARARAGFAAGFAVLALLFQPFWTIFRVGGQTTPTVFLLLVLAMMAHTRGREGTTAALLVAAAAIKPAFAPVLILLALLAGPGMIMWAGVWTGAAAAVSVALLGWPIHAEFLDQLREGSGPARSPWFYNSAPSVLIGNTVLLENPGPELPYRILGWFIPAGVIAAMGYLVLKSRAERWLPSARRHFHFMIAVLTCLLLGSVVWEHYLTAMFLLLAFLVAQREQLAVPARALLATIVVLSLAQNLVVVNFVRTHVTLDGHVQLLMVGLVKSAPLWLAAVLLTVFRQHVFRAYHAASWPAQQRTVPAVDEITTAAMASAPGSP